MLGKPDTAEAAPFEKEFLSDLFFEEATDSDVEQFKVMLESMRIFHERNKQRGDETWRKRGWKGILLHQDSKMIRIMASQWFGQGTGSGEDDDLDLINYTAMKLRLQREGNEHGSL